MQIVVVGAMALLALIGAVQVARGGEWFLVALPVCVCGCAIGLTGLMTGNSFKGRRGIALPVLLVGVLGIVATATSEAPINIFMVLALPLQSLMH